MSACSDDNDDDISITEGVLMVDIPADTGGVSGGPPGQGPPPVFTYVDLETQTIVTDPNSTQWDLAFASTTILTNSGISGDGTGGAIVLDTPFAELEAAATTGYAIDTDTLLAVPFGSGNGWYNYDFRTNIVSPIPNKTILVRSGDGGSYAKVEMLNYYRGNPDMTTEAFINEETRPRNRYYTIRIYNF
ncbi:MAG: HmuY family protein [Bacteroidota bacterium]